MSKVNFISDLHPSQAMRTSNGHTFLVSPEDISLVNRYTWYYSGNRVYTQRMYKGKRYSKSLHRLITQCPKGLVVDHIDRNPINNCRYNLRICTSQQNSYNMGPKKGKYKGVYYKKDREKFRAEIRINYKKVHLGYFENELEAAEAYNKAARKYHKEYAYINLLA